MWQWNLRLLSKENIIQFHWTITLLGKPKEYELKLSMSHSIMSLSTLLKRLSTKKTVYLILLLFASFSEFIHDLVATQLPSTNLLGNSTLGEIRKVKRGLSIMPNASTSLQGNHVQQGSDNWCSNLQMHLNL